LLASKNKNETNSNLKTIVKLHVIKKLLAFQLEMGLEPE
jgi:hypothetical protein